MKNLCFIILLISVLVQSCSQKKEEIKEEVSFGKIDRFYSRILHEERKIWIYLPESAKNNGSDLRYPVVYLLDGDAHFYSVAGMIHQLSSVNGNTICPEMIVVGIPNTDRTRDLTPTHVKDDLPYIDSAFSINSGGGEKFISFWEKELIPYIDSVYPTQPYRMLIGHSFGGLIVMHTLVHHTSLFNSYVSIDPSMWWDQRKLLNEIKSSINTQSYPGTSLFLGIANTMEPGRDTLEIKTDTANNSKHIRSILELNSTLSQTTKNQLKYQAKYYGQDDHGSVPLISTYDALHFIFDFFPLKLDRKEYEDSSTAVISTIENHYLNIKSKLGYDAKPQEETIRYFADNALNKKHYKKAEAYLNLNIKYFPKSSNAYEALGDYYVAISEKLKAEEQYKKALTIKESSELRQKLNKLNPN